MRARRHEAGGAVVVALVVALGAAPVRGQADGGGTPLLPDPQQMARVEAAVDRALEYLLKHQHADGSWPSGKGINNGINAICLLAFLGRGHVPGRGPYHLVVDRAVTFIRATQRADGLFQTPSGWNGTMYEHGLCTLAMIESYGFLASADMRGAVQRAVDLIVKVQAPVGGWRYHPQPNDADLSVTVMQVVALRAAQNARLEVPQKTIDAARKYVDSCATPNGGFSYQPGRGPSPAQSAAGALSMLLLGAYDEPELMAKTKAGLEYLHKVGYSEGMGYFWYTNYYAMQATFQAGGDHWQRWHTKARDLLLRHQRENGSWPGWSEAQYAGPTECYSTALGAMILEVYMHYLPAYQR